MSVDVGTTVERLLPRFEALRSGSPVKVLAISATADAMQSGELPLAYKEFAESPRTLGTLYGYRARDFRFLGIPTDIDRFLWAAEASGKLFKGRLNQAHLVKDRELPGVLGTASQALWLISLFSAAAGKQLATDGLAGGDWYLWHQARDLAVAKRTVQQYRGPRPAAAALFAPALELAQSDEEPIAFAVLEDAAETSIALLHWLADIEPKTVTPAKSTRPKKPFRNLNECIKHIMKTAGGKDRILSCSTLSAVCVYIGQECPGQPVSAPGLKGSWPEDVEWPWGKKKKHPGHTVVPASLIGDDFDLDRFETRPSQPSSTSKSNFKCASCGEKITRNGVQLDQKLYCQECGEEKQGEGAGQHLQKR